MKKKINFLILFGAVLGLVFLTTNTTFAACQDTDNGKVWGVQGKCYEDGVLKGTDNCVTDEYLYEWWCYEDSCVMAGHHCSPDNCLGGLGICGSMTCDKLLQELERQKGFETDNGGCCPLNTYCSSGFVSGASDCLNCCLDVNDCKASGAPPDENGTPPDENDTPPNGDGTPYDNYSAPYDGNSTPFNGNTLPNGDNSNNSPSTGNPNTLATQTGGCPTEGLVPCGTPGCPCTFCHLFILFNNIIRFVTITIVPIIAVIMLIVGGVMFFFAGAKPDILNKAKDIITSVVIGLLIILCAWVIVNTILVKSGIVKSPSLLEWYKIECVSQ